MTPALGHRDRSVGMRRGLAAVAGACLLVLVTAPPAGAGGWAVSTLDPVSAPVAGASTRVGFTIRQHGVRPVNPEGRVGIGVRDAAGGERFFAGTPQGPPGHYVARVEFATAGTFRWKVLQGWFTADDLGPVHVVAARSSGVAAGGGVESGTTGGGYRWPLGARVLLPVAGIVFGALAIALARRDRRGRRHLVTT